MRRYTETLRSLLVAWLVVATAVPAWGQGGSKSLWDVTDPPVFAISASTYNITAGVVERASGTFNFPTWAAAGRILHNGTLYTVASRDDVDQLTLNDNTVNASGVTISLGPDASFPNDAVDDTAHLQAFFDAGIGLIGSTIVIPGSDPRHDLDDANTNEWGYLLSSQLTISLQQGLRILGGGVARQVAVHPTTLAGGAPLKNARFTWAGGAGSTGPMVLIKDCSGIVLDGMNFIGNDGSDSVTPLVRFDNTSEGSNDLASVIRISNCSFHQYQIGVQVMSSVGSHSAEFMVDNCMFDGNQAQSTWEAVTANPVTQAAFWVDKDQSLNFTFQHCEVIDSAVNLYFKKGGSFRWYGGSSSLVGDFLRRDDGSQNNSQFTINDLYIDASGSTRQILMRSGEPNGAGAGDTWGNVIFSNFRHSSGYPSFADDWVVVSAWPNGDNTITFSEPIEIAPGQTLSFQDADHASGTQGPVVATTTITSRTSATQYEVSDTPDGLGVDALVASGDLRANEANTTARSCVGSYSGNTLVLVDDINVRVGDTFAFVDSSDPENRIATAKITAKSSEFSYTLESTAAELDVDDELAAGTLRVLDGTPLFACTGGERLIVRDAYFSTGAVQAGRLARITRGTFAGGRNTYIDFQNCSLDAAMPIDLPNRYLLRRASDLGDAFSPSITAPVEPAWYRFRDCHFFETHTNVPPFSISNIPPFQRVTTTNPTPQDDVDAGYPVGSLWQNSNTGKVFVHAADGRWIEITHRAPAPF